MLFMWKRADMLLILSLFFSAIVMGFGMLLCMLNANNLTIPPVAPAAPLPTPDNSDELPDSEVIVTGLPTLNHVNSESNSASTIAIND